MTPMRSVYPCRYLHELNSYCTSVQRRIAPSRSPKQLIDSSLSKQDQVSDSSSPFASSTSLQEFNEYYSRDIGWNYSLLGAVTPSHRSSSPGRRPYAHWWFFVFAAGHSQEIHPVLPWTSLTSGQYPFVCSKGISFFPFCVCIYLFLFPFLIGYGRSIR